MSGRSHGHNRHVHRIRVVYRRWRNALLKAIVKHLPGLTVEGWRPGSTCLRLLTGCDDEAVAAAAEGHGVRVAPLSTYSISRPTWQGLVIGYGRVAELALEGGPRWRGPSPRPLRLVLFRRGRSDLQQAARDRVDHQR